MNIVKVLAITVCVLANNNLWSQFPGIHSNQYVSHISGNFYGLFGEFINTEKQLRIGLDFINTYDGISSSGVNILKLQADGLGNVVIGRTQQGTGSNLADGKVYIQALHDSLPDLKFQGIARTYAEKDYIVHLDVNGIGNRDFIVTAGDYNGGILGNLALFRVNENGNAYLLGDLNISGKISASNFPDYVFDPDYPLLSLPDLKIKIDQLGHLPEMPSAQEVACNGLLIGDMSIKLLKKVEELTLYVLDLQDQLNEANQKIQMLGQQDGSIYKCKN